MLPLLVSFDDISDSRYHCVKYLRIYELSEPVKARSIVILTLIDPLISTLSYTISDWLIISSCRLVYVSIQIFLDKLFGRLTCFNADTDWFVLIVWVMLIKMKLFILLYILCKLTESLPTKITIFLLCSNIFYPI